MAKNRIMAVKLEPEMQKEIRRLAHLRFQSLSEFIRDALAKAIQEEKENLMNNLFNKVKKE